MADASLLTMAVTILLGEAVTLLIKLYADLRNSTLIWSVAFIKYQTQAGLLGDINKSFECVTITDSKFPNKDLVRMMPKSTSRNWVTI